MHSSRFTVHRLIKKYPNIKCNINININVNIRCYGILELEQKFGKNFKKVHDLDLDTATPLEKKMHTFITKIQKSPTLDDKVKIHETEIVATPETDEKGKQGKSRPNMAKIIQESYNWNPYHNAAAENNDKMQHDHLDMIPDEYKQAGWGMQPQSITGSPLIHKMFPNSDILKNMIIEGQRVGDIGHLFSNPLKDLGYRSPNISDGRDYNVLETVLEPYTSNVIEEWHGSQTIKSQKHRDPPSEIDGDVDIDDKYNLTKKQLVMRRLKQYAERSYLDSSSLPPFKFGFEDIPVFISQINYHSPDKLGDPKRTRELCAKVSIYMKYLYPNMTKSQSIAIKLLCSKTGRYVSKKQTNNMFYNEKTTKYNLYCNNHYFYNENESQIVEWISKLITEIDRFSEYIDNNHNEFGDDKSITWEDYAAMYQNEFNNDNIRRKWNKYRFNNKMLSLPKHIRSNYNLYCNGNRMNKLTKYCDLLYNNTFIDASNILQKEGPITRSGCATNYYTNYIPTNKYEIMKNIDNLPKNPSEYILNREFRDRMNDEQNTPTFKVINIRRDQSKSTSAFGVNSCYQIPADDSVFDNYENAYHIPLTQPFTGLRLRKFKMTPWSNSSMMKIYRNRKQSRVGMKLIFGDEQLKKITLEKIIEIEKEQAKQKEKLNTQKLSQGRKRQRKKAAALKHIEEQREVRKRENQKKDAATPENNSFFLYLGSKKIAKQFKSQISDISK